MKAAGDNGRGTVAPVSLKDDVDFYQVRALIRPWRLASVVKALNDMGIRGMRRGGRGGHLIASLTNLVFAPRTFSCLSGVGALLLFLACPFARPFIALVRFEGELCSLFRAPRSCTLTALCVILFVTRHDDESPAG